MSSVLLHAVSCGKIVLAPEFGLIGELLRRYDLGVSYDDSEPSSLEQGLSRCLERAVQTNPEESARLKAWAVKHSAFSERFGNMVCSSILKTVEKV